MTNGKIENSKIEFGVRKDSKENLNSFPKTTLNASLDNITRPSNNITRPSRTRPSNNTKTTTKNNTKSTTKNNTTLFGFIFMSWLVPMMRLAKKRPLELLDILACPLKDSAHYLVEKLYSTGYTTTNTTGSTTTTGYTTTTLKSALNRVLWKKCFFVMVMVFLNSAATVSIPLLVSRIISLIEKGQAYSKIGFSYAAIIFILTIIREISFEMQQLIWYKIEFANSSVLNSLILEKSLKLSPSSKTKFTTSDIMTMVQTEVPLAMLFQAWFLAAPICIVQIAIQCWLLFYILGMSFLLAIGIIVIVTFATSWYANRLTRYIQGWREGANARLSILRELLQGIKFVKFSASEPTFMSKINNARSSQLGHIQSFFWGKAAMGGITLSVSIIVAVVTFSVYAALGNQLTAEIIFPSLLLFNMTDPLKHVTDAVEMTSQAQGSIKRIEEFLNLEESNRDDVLESDHHADDDIEDSSSSPSRCVEITKASWKIESTSTSSDSVEEWTCFQLYIKQLECFKNKMYGICGPVGSGKSLLLRGILNQIPLVSGTCTTLHHSGKKIAYTSQTPWMMKSTIAKNITFYRRVNQKRLLQVVYVCGLGPDLKSFSLGLDTPIGDNGVNLSGGQKSRIALARALYADADLYLLDDPLASCDAKVVQHIMHHMKLFLKEKCVLLTSHSRDVLDVVDVVVQLDQGRVIDTRNVTQQRHQDDYKEDVGYRIPQNVVLRTQESSSQVRKVNSIESNLESNCGQSNSGFIQHEEKQTGRVQTKLYAKILRSLGMPILLMLALAFLLSLSTSIASPIWLTKWATNVDASKSKMFLVVYALLGAADFSTTIVQAGLYALGGLKMSKFYHDSAMKGIIQAPMSFFDTNPVGRILNRLNGDVALLDLQMPRYFAFISAQIIQFIATMVVVTLVSPFLILIFVFLIVFSYSILQFFQHGYVEINRLKPMTCSKLESTLNEVLEGLETIQAFKTEKVFLYRFQERIDLNQSCSFSAAIMTLWLRQKICLCASLVSLSVSLFGCFLTSSPALASLIGVALAYSSTLEMTITSIFTYASCIEGGMNAFERLDYYSTSLSIEGETSTTSKPPTLSNQDLVNWPCRGGIEFRNVSLCYGGQTEDPVIKNMSLLVEPGKKIGICGRSGCGKSTLISSLFRLMECQEGSILIDGIDISQIPLQSLRQKIQIITQDPILFSGTIRSNLVDLGETIVSDARVWETLQQVGLYDFVSDLELKLDSVVEEKGSNFSYGQRQLFCMARALLKEPLLLIMDEATASIDNETDLKIQALLQTEFSKSTVLCIAHRIDSIMACDKILVLDQGRVGEYDTPDNLLQIPDSLFNGLYHASNR